MRLALPATLLALAGTAALVSLPAALRADESARDAVERLMPQLLSEDETQRADAEKSLFALGEAGRTELERITRENDPRRAITALRLLESGKWAKAAKPDGERKAQREDAGADWDASTALPARLEEMRARLDREMEEFRRRFESFDRSFTLHMPQFEWGAVHPGGASSGTVVENDKKLSWSIDADGRVKVTVQDGKDAPEQKYEAPSIEALKKEHPDVAKRLESVTGSDSWTVTLNGAGGPHVRVLRGGQRRIDAPDEDGAPQTPVLGVSWSPVSEVLRDQLDLGDGGIVVESVVAKSLAEKLGLARNDVLLEVQGKAIGDSADVRAALENAKEGDKVTALVVRKGRKQTLDAVK